MKIQSVHQTTMLLSVRATVDGTSFEYTSHNGKPFEVYDFPKSWKGVPRQVGNLDAERGKKLMAVLERDGWIGGTWRPMDNGPERVPTRCGPTSREHSINTLLPRESASAKKSPRAKRTEKPRR